MKHHPYRRTVFVTFFDPSGEEYWQWRCWCRLDRRAKCHQRGLR